jgi:hypothetical protein
MIKNMELEKNKKYQKFIYLLETDGFPEYATFDEKLAIEKMYETAKQWMEENAVLNGGKIIKQNEWMLKLISPEKDYSINVDITDIPLIEREDLD